MIRQYSAALLLAFLCPAVVLRAQNPSRAAENDITAVFDQVGALQPMRAGITYTTLVDGKLVSGDADSFLRRRGGAEILKDGLTSGCGDNAIAAYSLFEQRGYETRFIDAAEISTQSLESNFAGHAAVAIRDPKTGLWIFVDPTRRTYSYPFTVSDKAFYGNYWIGFCGRLADYPAHDAASLKKFYRDTLNTVPKEVLNQTLFRFRYSVDPSMTGPDGKYRNPNLEVFLRDNGKILAAHDVHPVNEVAIRLTNGEDTAESQCEYASPSGWECTIGQRSALSLGFVSYLENRLNEAREKGEPLGIVASSAIPPGVWWAGSAVFGLAILALLLWQARRIPGGRTTIAYWVCQLFGWSWMFLVAFALKKIDASLQVIADSVVVVLSGILLTDVVRRRMRRRGWLQLSAARRATRLVAAVLLMAVLQVMLTWITDLAFRDPRLTFEYVAARLPSTVLLFGAWVVLYIVLTAPRRQREANAQLGLALKEAELRVLEAQINPHFLFNSLNSIRALVVENPARSQDMITRLANILRYSLRRDLDHTVPLHSEVEMVGDYLELESARFEDRMKVEISIDPSAGDVEVPPMLLQSLVENAIKHGIAPLPSGGELLIRARLVDGSMLMEVENTGEVSPALEGTQTGLANIRERLRLLYNGRASFELKSRDGRVAATVLIPRTA